MSINATVVSPVPHNCWMNGTLAPCPFKDGPGLLSVVAPEPHRLVGCWIPKVASRFVVQAMNDLTGCRQHPLYNCSLKLCGPHGKDPSQMNHCKGITLKAAYGTPHKYLRFVVLRDPLTRFLSCYLDKFSEHAAKQPQNNYKNHDHYGGQLTTWRHYLESTKLKPTIETLLGAIARDQVSGEISSHVEYHLRQQTHMCFLTSLRYDVYIDETHLMDGFSALNSFAGHETGLASFAEATLTGAKQSTVVPEEHIKHADDLICRYITPAIEKDINRLYASDYRVLKTLGMGNLISKVTEVCRSKQP